jgi:predicted DsbA family dithiol-disulfide isomerase
MRTALLRNANLLSPGFISKTASDLQLDTTAFSTCLKDQQFDAEIKAEMAEASRIGVKGTPTFVIGRTPAEALDGVVIVGAQPYAVFEKKFKELLASGSK